MAVYVAMEPPGGGHDGDATVFVRDGFSLPGFLAPPLWLLWHRLWIEALLALAAIAVLAVAATAFGQPSIAALLILLVMLYSGLEGQALRIAAMARQGWRQWGVLVADNPDDADARYAVEVAAAAPQQQPEPRLSPEPPVTRSAQSQPISAIGLVPFSGKH